MFEYLPNVATSFQNICGCTLSISFRKQIYTHSLSTTSLKDERGGSVIECLSWRLCVVSPEALRVLKRHFILCLVLENCSLGCKSKVKLDLGEKGFI